MGIRNCRDIGENLQKIVMRLLANDNLVNLLYYGDNDPLAKNKLSTEEKNELIFNQLIKIVPRVGVTELEHSIISIRVLSGNQLSDNTEFKTVEIGIEVFVPWGQWIIKDTNLRPFAILGEIQESLNNKTVNGLGKMTGGNFILSYMTNEVVCYEASYSITSYD